MPITINGSGTITGLSAGGLPDGTIQPADLSTGAPTWDTSGNVGIGTSSPAVSGSAASTLNVKGTSTNNAALLTVQSNDGGSSVQFWSGNNNTDNPAVVFQKNLRFGTATDGGVGGFTERARIDSSGNLLVNRDTATIFGAPSRFVAQSDSSTTWVAAFNNTRTGTVNSNFIAFGREGTLTGSIANTNTATAYNTSSDYRLKENIQPMTGALEKVCALKPCTYTWKANGFAGEGFIAHELAEVCPGAVTGEKDAVNEDGSINPQGIDTSFLVATLTAAIQELNAKVDAQAAEIAALKGAA